MTEHVTPPMDDLDKLVAQARSIALSGFLTASPRLLNDLATALLQLRSERDEAIQSAFAYSETAKMQREWKETAERQLAEAREALRPFAHASIDCDDDCVHDNCSAWESAEANCVTIGDFRAASRALGGRESPASPAGGDCSR